MDACKEGISGVLSQNVLVVCYESRKLKENERIYVMHDLELETTVHVLNMWKHYLMGKRFELRTYHCGLKYLFGQPSLNDRQCKWLEFLNDYDFEINQIREKKTRWMIHLVGGWMKCMLQPLANLKWVIMYF